MVLDERDAQLIFFHDGIIDEPISWHYNCIEVETTALSDPLYYQGKLIHVGLNLVACPFPMLLPQVTEVVYLRNEPNIQFNEINTFLPEWVAGSVIRLKVNEALRGKVTPALREIHLTWNDVKTEVLITFFHNVEITKEIYKHYEEIFNIAVTTSASWKNENGVIIPKLEVKYVPFPEKIVGPLGFNRLYRRKEPFIEPI